MFAPDAGAETPTTSQSSPSISPTGLLASALLHLVDRDEPVPARWRSDAFTASVARHRVVLATIATPGALDRLAHILPVTSFSSAASVLARDPFAAALAVRRIELRRGAPLPPWPELARHGVASAVAVAVDGGRSR